MTDDPPEDADTDGGIVRLDRWSITVDGHRVTAREETEARIRALNPEQRARLVKVLGG